MFPAVDFPGGPIQLTNCLLIFCGASVAVDICLFIFCDTHCGLLEVPENISWWRSLFFWFRRLIMACAEDMRVLLERIGRMERALWNSKLTGVERHHGRRPEDPSGVACVAPFELPPGTRGVQRVDHAASSWPRTHATGHLALSMRRAKARTRTGARAGHRQARHRGDVPLLQQGGPSKRLIAGA